MTIRHSHFIYSATRRVNIMHRDTYHYLKSQPQLLHFVRANPIWYRYLMRDPYRITDLEKEAKVFYGKTLSQRLEKVNHQIQMVQLLVNLSGLMKD